MVRSLPQEQANSVLAQEHLPPLTFSRPQTPGGVTAACWNANVSPTTLQPLQSLHLSRDMFITHSFGPKISVGTRHPSCVMNPSSRLPCHPRLTLKGPPLPPSAPRMSFTSLCLHSCYFSPRNISQQGCAWRGPKLRLERMSRYPSRWCANVAADIKVFRLIIIRGIRLHHLSLRSNLAKRYATS